METSPHPDLQLIKVRLLQIYEAISTFKPLIARPPILDSSYDPSNQDHENQENQWLHPENVPGLKKLKENIKIDLDVLEKFLDDPKCATLPPLSTNAPYLVAVWNELICAPPPIVSVFRAFPINASVVTPAEKALSRNLQQPPPSTKVDIVADNGRQWIRVNTIKNSRMLSEFREIDSYLTDSEGSDEDWDDIERPSLAQTEFDNSVLRMGRSLLQTARANPIEGTSEIPKITLRLTRLDPDLPGNDDGTPPDPRIAQTLRTLQEMGVRVELGERSDDEIAAAPNPSSSESSSDTTYTPTQNINLDLSVLIALISDLTHAALPQSIEEANKRFVPPQEYREWKLKHKGPTMNGKFKAPKPIAQADGDDPTQSQPPTDPSESLALGLETDINDLPRNLIKHARALTNQLLQEMSKGLLQEIYDRIATHSSSQNDKASPTSMTLNHVTFWTTPEARDRCLRIVSKIGGVHEKRRARGIFCLAPDVMTPDSTSRTPIPLEEGERLYWQDSRFPLGFIPLLPIQILSPEDAATQHLPKSISNSAFGLSLNKVCTDILAQETIPHPRAVPTASSTTNSPSASTLPSSSDQIQRATVTKANPRLTAHTVQSLQWGARLGWTTLTANRTSVKAILKEMKAASRRIGAGVGLEEEKEDGEERPKDDSEYQGVDSGFNSASIWIIDPRSLAEGMSSSRPVS